VQTSFIDREIDRIRKVCGENGHVIGAVSGGVDSTVAAALLSRAIGDRYLAYVYGIFLFTLLLLTSRFHAILVDNGLLRLNEADEAFHKLKEQLNVNLTVVDASELFLGKLKGVTDPEKKRKIIGNTFIEVFEVEAKKFGDAEFLLQGTLYPDVIESISFKGPSATIKTHHVPSPPFFSKHCLFSYVFFLVAECRWPPGRDEAQVDRASARALQG